jgi:hypothetical protein
LQELPLIEPAQSIEWYQGTLCLGFKKEYMLMSSENGETSPLFPLEKSGPLMKLCTEEILLAREGKLKIQ